MFMILSHTTYRFVPDVSEIEFDTRNVGLACLRDKVKLAFFNPSLILYKRLSECCMEMERGWRCSREEGDGERVEMQGGWRCREGCKLSGDGVIGSK